MKKNTMLFVGTPENINARLENFEAIQNTRGGLVSWEVSSPSLTVKDGEAIVAVTVSWMTDLSKTVNDRIRV
jgi:phage host-nuclease inhibitor protein Gam